MYKYIIHHHHPPEGENGKPTDIEKKERKMPIIRHICLPASDFTFQLNIHHFFSFVFHSFCLDCRILRCSYYFAGWICARPRSHMCCMWHDRPAANARFVRLYTMRPNSIHLFGLNWTNVKPSTRRTVYFKCWRCTAHIHIVFTQARRYTLGSIVCMRCERHTISNDLISGGLIQGTFRV